MAKSRNRFDDYVALEGYYCTPLSPVVTVPPVGYIRDAQGKEFFGRYRPEEGHTLLSKFSFINKDKAPEKQQTEDAQKTASPKTPSQTQS